MNYWIGQGFGILSTITEIILPQFRKKWQMLIANICVNSFLALNLVFLNRIGSGVFLFAVAIVQATINLIHTLRKKPPKKWEYALFFCLYVGFGFYGLVTAPGFVPGINPQNLLELLPIIGAVFSMLFVSARDERMARRFLLVCDMHWNVYLAIIGSTSLIGSLCSTGSCIVAMLRDKRERAKQKT